METNQTFLKAETDIEHRSMEKTLHASGALQSKEGYRIAIQAMQSFYQAIEDQFDKYSEELLKVGIDLEIRNKSKKLKRDLKSLNLTELNRASDIPNLESLSEVIGALYVLEGSTLGGQVITKLLVRNKIIEDIHHGGEFFNGYGETNSSMWNDFKNVLNSFSENERLSILKGAKLTFSAMEKHLRSICRMAE